MEGEQLRFFEIPAEFLSFLFFSFFKLFLLVITKRKTKCKDAKWLPIFVLLAQYYLTSVTWPFTLTAFTFESCLYDCKLGQLGEFWLMKMEETAETKLIESDRTY